MLLEAGIAHGLSSNPHLLSVCWLSGVPYLNEAMLAEKCVPPRMAITVCSMNAAEDDQSGFVSIVALPKVRADREHKTAMCM